MHNGPPGLIAHSFDGVPLGQSPFLIVWGHGWGHNRSVFAPFAASLSRQASHLLIDFPGFGASPMPPEVWDTAAYADAVASLLAPLREQVPFIVWVGHSFGCRVGIQLAARHPKLVDAMALMAGAGLPRHRSLAQRLRIKGRILFFKLCKKLAPLVGISVEDLRNKFGSADYRQAGAMRPIFLKTISEDLTPQARQVACPTLLLYGEQDTETPPEIGQRLATLIKGSELTLLPGLDHYTILDRGRALVLKRLTALMERLS